MSLAVLARKTRTKQRLKSMNCGNMRNRGRTAGFVLNMTGRGTNGIRTGPKPSAKYNGGGCKGLRGENCGFGCKGCCEVSCKGGQRHSCCGKKKVVSKECRDSCGLCWYQGLSQPAPQMSYGVYLARKSGGAYRPSGRKCCDCSDPQCNANRDANPRRNPNTWKQSPNISAGTIIERKRLAAITCARQRRKFKSVMLGNTCISNKLDARPPCSYYNTATKTWIQPKESPLIRKCTRTMERVWGRLTYTRINQNWCGTTKAVAQGQSASDKIALRKSEAFSCQCWNDGSKDMAYMKIGMAPTSSSRRIWGWRSSRPAKGRAAWGAFKGTISNLEVRRLQIVWDIHSPPHDAQLLLTLLLAHLDQPVPSITSVSFLATDGTTVTQPMPLTWPGEHGNKPPRIVYASRIGDNNISKTLQFFRNHEGQYVKVHWAPGPQSNKCNRTNRKLFKNPSVRCPSPSSNGHVESLCS